MNALDSMSSNHAAPNWYNVGKSRLIDLPSQWKAWAHYSPLVMFSHALNFLFGRKIQNVVVVTLGRALELPDISHVMHTSHPQAVKNHTKNVSIKTS